MKAEGQWIVMMGFLVSLGIFFLAIIISQSTLVGQTTAEGVLEFPKNDIQDLRHDILEVEIFERTNCPTGCQGIMSNLSQEIRQISLYRKSALVNYTITPSPWICGSEGGGHRVVNINYNNGVTVYNETTTIWFSC
jgi:hypothetical protein